MASPAASQGTGGGVVRGQRTGHKTQDIQYTAGGLLGAGRGGGWPSAILVALPVRPGWRGRSGVPRILIVSISNQDQRRPGHQTQRPSDQREIKNSK